MKKYYYHHAESDTLWSSNLDCEEEGNPDGCTEPITFVRAMKLKREIGMDKIPHYINRVEVK